MTNPFTIPALLLPGCGPDLPDTAVHLSVDSVGYGEVRKVEANSELLDDALLDDALYVTSSYGAPLELQIEIKTDIDAFENGTIVSAAFFQILGFDTYEAFPNQPVVAWDEGSLDYLGKDISSQLVLEDSFTEWAVGSYSLEQYNEQYNLTVALPESTVADLATAEDPTWGGHVFITAEGKYIAENPTDVITVSAETLVGYTTSFPTTETSLADEPAE